MNNIKNIYKTKAGTYQVQIRKVRYVVFDKTFNNIKQARIERDIIRKEYFKYSFDAEYFIKQILDITGFDVRIYDRSREALYYRSIFCYIAYNHFGYGCYRIANILKREHGSVENMVKKVFHEAVKYSKIHRELYFKLINKKDPEILEETETTTTIDKSLIKDVLDKSGFFLKPHHKRQLEKLLNK